MSRNWVIILIAVFVALTAGIFIIYRHAPRQAPAKAQAPKRHTLAEKAAVLRQKARALPAVLKKFKQPRVAVVVDDFGYNTNNLDNLFAIEQPVTLSILPGLAYSTEVARLAAGHGREVILHLPLESHRRDVREEFDTIRSTMSEKEVIERLTEEIATVPGLKGVSNHMGSKSTEERALMDIILGYLKARNLYFLDSLTSNRSVCRDAASAIGARFARRDIFLDNSGDPAEIEKQMLALRRLAFRKGRAVAVCHDRKTTIEALARMMPELSRDGISFVPLSEIVRR